MTWVKPELVCQVKYANWTQDDRLRAPVFLGLRNDKAARAVEVRSAESRPEPRCCSRKRQGGDAPDRRPRPQVHQPHKVFYPDDGYTKRDVLNYYDAVADLILPHLKDRPLSLKRYPNGIKEQYLLPEGHARDVSRRGCAPN